MPKRTWSDANGGSTVASTTAVSPAVSKTHRQSTSDAGQQPAKRHSTSGANGTASVDQHLPQISRKIKACAACRKHKIKCLMDDNGPPCRRCSERNLSCVLSKSLQTIIDEKSQFSEAIVQDLEQMHGALKEVMNKMGLSELPPLQSSSAHGAEGTPPKDETAISNGSNRFQDEHPGPSCDNSPKATPEDEGLPYVPIHSLYALTKLRALRSPDDTEAQRSRGIDDFISRGAISLSDAESLFALYRDRLDAYMYHIGCRYKTLDELRRKSSILSAATLTVAALHDPKANGIYGICSSEFRRLMEKSMFDRRIDRDYLRAMCVAAYWLSDISWMVSGYAIRRAAECNLHNSYSRAIKENSPEAADCTRLWYILYICDQHLATLYGRPSIVQEDSSISGWEKFLQTQPSTPEDKRLTGQVALVSILRSIRELFGSDKSEPIPRVYLNQITHLRRQLDQWAEQQLGDLPLEFPGIGAFPRKGTVLHSYFVQLHLYSHVFRGLSGKDPIPHYFLDCASKAIEAATSIIDFILADPDVASGIIGMPSYLHSMTAFACMFLIKVAIKYGNDLIEPQRVYDLTTNLVRQFRSLPTGKWHLANLMSGGLERMAKTLKIDRQSIPTQNLASIGNFNTPGAAAGSNSSTGMMGQMTGSDMPELDGSVFFDYDMNFELSPEFRFDPAILDVDGSGAAMQGFVEVDYGMGHDS